jgi:hypothetical protein
MDPNLDPSFDFSGLLLAPESPEEQPSAATCKFFLSSCIRYDSQLNNA